MNLIQSPVVWGIGVVALAIVLIVALTKSRKSLRIAGGGFEASVGQPASPGADHRVSVAEEAVVERKVGNVVGVRGGPAAGPVDVARNAHFKGEAGDIIGVDLTSDKT